ncbi:MAG: hypothetical protein R6W92_04845 [Desulfocurvibacter africanus]
MNESINIKIEKSDVPVLWLDTSVLNTIVMLKTGKPIEASRKVIASDLYQKIYAAIRNCKLICPLAEQDDEVWVERKDWLRVVNKLTLGINTRPELGIKESQLFASMKCYLEISKEMVYYTKDIFYEDPVRELRYNLSSPFFVTVDTPLIRGAGYQRKLKSNIVNGWNSLRLENNKEGVKFKTQLDREYGGELLAYQQFVQDYFRQDYVDEEHEMNTAFGFLNFGSVLRLWRLASKQGDDFQGLIQFFSSPFYKEMPYTKLRCNLMAHLVTDKQEIKSGDYKDLQHIYTVMPYVNLFITDKKWSNFLNRRGLGEIYNTVVCYIGDTEEIDRFFSNLN